MKVRETMRATSGDIGDTTKDFPRQPQPATEGNQTSAPLQDFKATNDLVDCPGGCGGVAELEPPHTVTRDGQTRMFRMAQCQGQCKTERTSSLSKRPRFVAARFEIPWSPSAPGEVDPPAFADSATSITKAMSPTELSQLLTKAFNDHKVTQLEAAHQIGCSQSSVSKMLRGVPVAETTSEAAVAWTQKNMTSQGFSASNLDRKSVEHPKKERRITPEERPCAVTPYEAILRRMLEQVAQERLEEIAGAAAKGVVVRVILEWSQER